MNEQDTDRPRRSPARRVLRTAGAALVLLSALVGIGACMNLGERLAYFPSRDRFVTPPGIEDVEFATADGVRLHGWFMPAIDAGPGEVRPAVLHAHGNAGHVASHAGFSAFLRERGMHVLVFDYRGYGRSDDARPSRRPLLDDTRAALAYLRSRADVDGDRIGVYGVSLGGAFALPVAAEDERVRAVATLSAFSAWRGAAHDMVPVLGPLLIRAGVDPEDGAARLGDRPYLVVHGDADQVIDVRHATRLRDAAAAAGVDVRMLVAQGADHNALIETHPDVREAIAVFFEEHLGTPEAP